MLFEIHALAESASPCSEGTYFMSGEDGPKFRFQTQEKACLLAPLLLFLSMCKINNNHTIFFCNEFSTWMVFTTSKDGHIVTYHAGYSEQIMIVFSVRFDNFQTFLHLEFAYLSHHSFYGIDLICHWTVLFLWVITFENDKMHVYSDHILYKRCMFIQIIFFTNLFPEKKGHSKLI
jgi:hypothetical protein